MSMDESRNEIAGQIGDSIHKSSSGRNKWLTIVMLIILVITIMQMVELIKISEALKSIDLKAK